MVGALIAVNLTERTDSVLYAINLLRRATGHNNLEQWNDLPSRTHEEVIAAFDKAIAERLVEIVNKNC